jgi:long-subunit acyl-CoA synthetase (AMP-forming)
MDEDGRELPIGEPGELWVRAPNVMKGYWRNAKATSETMTSDGWLKTGDICRVDKDGKFFIVDRKKVQAIEASLVRICKLTWKQGTHQSQRLPGSSC